jgi:hypothetical protein
METEVWKPVVGYPELSHAEVSNLGRVRTLDRHAPSKRAKQPTQLRRGGIISPWLGRAGYLQIQIKVGEARRKYYVHRLVALAFVPGHFEGATVDHIDGDKLNNLPGNLQWVTLSRNTQLQWQTGLVDIRGEKHPSAKLTNAEAAHVLRSADSASSLAEQFNVSTGLVYKIRSGKKRVLT